MSENKFILEFLFVKYFNSIVVVVYRLTQTCHDHAAMFVTLLAKPGTNYIEDDDLVPLLQVSIHFCNDVIPTAHVTPRCFGLHNCIPTLL
jgi:uncharacterized protein YabE (DUF348 family)